MPPAQSKQNANQTKRVTFLSPLGGVNQYTAREQQRTEPGQQGEQPTCWFSENILPFDSQYGRARVGQRFGIERAFTPQLGNGSQFIQGLEPVNFINYQPAGGLFPNLIPGPTIVPTINQTTPSANIPQGGQNFTKYPHALFLPFTMTMHGALIIRVGSGSPIMITDQVGIGFNITAWNTQTFTGDTINPAQFVDVYPLNLTGTFTVGQVIVPVVQGNGYSTLTTVAITGGGGTGVTASVQVGTAALAGKLISITTTAGGSGYTGSAPLTFSFSNVGSGSGASFSGIYVPLTHITADNVLASADNMSTMITLTGTYTMATAVSDASATSIFGAFGFFSQTPFASWAFYLNNTKAGLYATLNALAEQVNDPFSFNSILTPSSKAPPKIPVVFFQGGNDTGGFVAGNTMKDVAFP